MQHNDKFSDRKARGGKPPRDLAQDGANAQPEENIWKRPSRNKSGGAEGKEPRSAKPDSRSDERKERSSRSSERFEKRDRAEGGRPPRREFDKTERPARPDKKFDGGTESRSGKKFGEKRFDKKPHGKFENRERDNRSETPGGEGMERRPYQKRDRNESPTGKFGAERTGEKKFGEKRFDKRPYRKFDNPGSRDEAADGVSNREEGRPYKKREQGERPYGRPGAERTGEKRFSDKKFGDKKFGGKRSEGDAFGEKRFDKRPPRKDDRQGDKPSWTERKHIKDTPKKYGEARNMEQAESPVNHPVETGGEAVPVEPPFSKSLPDAAPVQEIRSPYQRPSERKTGAKKNIEVVSLKEERRLKKEQEQLEAGEDDKAARKRIPKKATKPAKLESDAEEGEDSAGETGAMPLNKYIAHSGECSRRDAAVMVKEGKVKVNGELVTEPGYKVKEDDKVTIAGKKVIPQKGLIYLLLNKPKGYITTNDDPNGRRTVMELVAGAGAKRLYPVGRLDRDTSGLLLITNDGDLTQRMSHPSFETKKVYQVTLDKHLTKADFEKIVSGLELEDGKVEVDEIAFLEEKNQIGIEIHSGKNRIVRRIFESLGYVVEKLDRVMYAGLTKKNLPRGKWRQLTDRELVLLKHFKS